MATNKYQNPDGSPRTFTPDEMARMSPMSRAQAQRLNELATFTMADYQQKYAGAKDYSDNNLYRTLQLRENPGYQLPDGFHVETTTGRPVVNRDPNFWDRNSNWLAPLIVGGIGGVGAAGAAGAFGAAGSAGGGGSAAATGGGLVGSGEAGITGSTALGGSVPSIAGTAGGGAAAGGVGMNLGTLSQLGQLGLGAYSAFSKPKQGEVPYSAQMEQMLGMQNERYQQANPLYQALIAMSMGMLPTQYRNGLTGSAPAAGAPLQGMPAAGVRRGGR
jgi:hypothetical protein